MSLPRDRCYTAGHSSKTHYEEQTQKDDLMVWISNHCLWSFVEISAILDVSNGCLLRRKEVQHAEELAVSDKAMHLVNSPSVPLTSLPGASSHLLTFFLQPIVGQALLSRCVVQQGKRAPMATPSFKPILLDLLHQAKLGEDTFVQELDPAELNVTSTPDFWSAKDHIAHLTFWRRRLVKRLTALVQHQEMPMDTASYEQLNPIIFEEQRDRPWSEIQAEAEQVYQELLTATEHLSEEDLTVPNRFAWHEKDDPLYTAFLGNCYEHAQDHLAQYYLERHDPVRATQIRETWTRRVTQAEVPGDLKGIVLYNLACFCALHDQLEQAATLLQEALALAPRLTEWSLVDPDLNVFH